ncbi:hypothetical protein [Nocardia sp. CC227C]|uniref:hypothetical protein n=1 Tax=Nocardia sp. CC227C TaxID=3044562 RepID=UPI00278C5517|nr:hypothetical protein [Nocardia sp. CC227C]
MKLIEDSISDIAQHVSVRELRDPTSHTAITAEGLERPEVTLALGRYLVAVLAGLVDIDARLSTALLGTGIDAQQELTSTISELIGDTNSFVEESEIKFRDTRRNAWIAEGVAHALLVVRARQNSELLTGPVHALKEQHSKPSQQGLDLVAIYSDNAEIMLAVGESKASRLDGSGQLTESASMFRKIDDGKYGTDLRAALLNLRRVLTADLLPQVTEALWKDKLCYLPVVFHEKMFDISADRPTLRTLRPPVARRRLVALRLNDFHGFFDSIADAMRAGICEVVSDV